MPQRLTIARTLKQAIEAQGARDYPHETCGFLLGDAGREGPRVRFLIEASNEDMADPGRFYRIDRAGYEHAEAEARARGLTILGIYHTHPDAAPVPSATDAEFAFPEWIYWITPVIEGEPGEPRLWLRVWKAAGWREVALHVEAG